MDYRYEVMFPKQRGEAACAMWLRELVARGFTLKPIGNDSLTEAPGIKVPANIETPATPATAPGLYPIGSAEEAAHAVALAERLFPGAGALVKPIQGIDKATGLKKPGFTLKDPELGGWLYNYHADLPRAWKYKVGDRKWLTDRAKVKATLDAMTAASA